MKYAGLGLQLLASIGVFAWIGHWLDSYFKFGFPVLLLTLVLIAFAGNMLIIYRSLTKGN
jgi:ATP synthase protein I